MSEGLAKPKPMYLVHDGVAGEHLLPVVEEVPQAPEASTGQLLPLHLAAAGQQTEHQARRVRGVPPEVAALCLMAPGVLLPATGAAVGHLSTPGTPRPLPRRQGTVAVIAPTQGPRSSLT